MVVVDLDAGDVTRAQPQLGTDGLDRGAHACAHDADLDALVEQRTHRFARVRHQLVDVDLLERGNVVARRLDEGEAPAVDLLHGDLAAHHRLGEVTHGGAAPPRELLDAFRGAQGRVAVENDGPDAQQPPHCRSGPGCRDDSLLTLAHMPVCSPSHGAAARYPDHVLPSLSARPIVSESPLRIIGRVFRRAAGRPVALRSAAAWRIEGQRR